MENKSNNNNKFPEDTFIEEENNIKTSIKNQPYNKQNIFEEKNVNINNDLIRTTLNEKTDEISKIFDESLNKGNLIDEDEEDSKDILLSLGFRKSKENDLLGKLSKIDNKNKDEYLTPKNWKYKNKNNYAELEKNFEKIRNNINKDEVKCLKDILKVKKIEDENDEYKIKKIEDLKDIEEKDEDKLNENIYKIRRIYIDNNSFYRAVVFSLFENMILTNNIMFFKELLIEIDRIHFNKVELFQDETIKKDIESNIKIDLMKKLIYILIKSMSKSIISSYELFLKIYLTQDEFDSNIILLMRYFLCFYINENKYKIYSLSEEIEIIGLLPQKYKEMHIPLNKKFELFYINELLKMKSYDSKIIYYMLPYFLDIDLNIIYYYPDSKNSFYQKQYGKQEDDDNLIINLFFYKSTFNIYYTKKFYDFHSKIIDTLGNNKDKINEKDIIPRDSDINIDTININEINNNINEISLKPNYICENCKKEYNNKENKENILKLCNKCLKEEFKNDVYKLYKLYLQYVNHNNKNYKRQRDNYFYSILHSTEINGISLFKAMNDSGYYIYKEIDILKKDICLICLKDDIRKNYYYKLPCNCRLCSKSCFNKYLDIMIKKHFEKMCDNSYKKLIFLFDFCICGRKYYYDDIIILYNFLKTKKRIKECQMIVKIVKNRWYWKCTRCDNNFDPFCLNKRLFLIDNKINKDFYTEKIKHLICSNCYESIKSNNKNSVECDYCKSEHHIEGHTKLTYKNQYPNSCTNY